MIKLISLIFTLLFSTTVLGQTSYLIDGFSSNYVGLIEIEKGYENDIFKKGTVSILSKLDSTRVITIKSDELTIDYTEQNDTDSGFLKVPYKKQNSIIFEDFNFDGLPDLAIMDGQHSCYHGPSFQIYLQKETFVHSSDFTRLAQDYCGMFNINYKLKTISTMTKSGCCWHQFSTFKIINEIPKPVLIIEEDATHLPFRVQHKTVWNSGVSKKTSKKTLDHEDSIIKELLSFRLSKNKKKVVIFSINDRSLNYALIKPDNTIEFNYPIETELENHSFKLNDSSIAFKNKNATYKIYENKINNEVSSIGVLVTVNGKQYNLNGTLTTIQGAIRDIKKTNLNNVIIE